MHHDVSPLKPNMTIAAKFPMNESMYFLLKMGMFQPVMLVFRGVSPLKIHEGFPVIHADVFSPSELS